MSLGQLVVSSLVTILGFRRGVFVLTLGRREQEARAIASQWIQDDLETGDSKDRDR